MSDTDSPANYRKRLERNTRRRRQRDRKGLCLGCGHKRDHRIVRNGKSRFAKLCKTCTFKATINHKNYRTNAKLRKMISLESFQVTAK